MRRSLLLFLLSLFAFQAEASSPGHGGSFGLVSGGELEHGTWGPGVKTDAGFSPIPNGPAPIFELTGTSGTALPVVGLTYDARDATASSWASKSGSITVSEQGAGTPTTGEPTPIDGAEAVGFSSTTYYQSTTDYTAPGTDPIHITALVKSPSTFGSDKRIIQARSASGSYPFDLLFNSTGDVQVFRLGDGATLRNVATSPVPAGAWMLIEAFLDPAGNGTIYVNGAQEGQSSISATGTTTQDNPITIGAFHSGVSTSDIQIAFVSVESGSSVLGTDSENLAAHQDRFYRLIGATAADGTLPTTATRSSAGYLTKANSSGDNQLFYVGENWPRFGSYNDGTTTRNAVQIEGAATNLLTYSEDFSNAAWTKLRQANSAESATVAAPDPSKFAFEVIPDNTTNSFPVRRAPSLSASTQYASSIYAKAGAFDWLYGNLFDGSTNYQVYFDIGTGAIGSELQGATGYIEDLGDGWYRCILETTTGGTIGSTQLNWYPAEADGDFTVAGDGSTVATYIFGAQLETGAYATSYIPTTSASATRAADALEYTLPALAPPYTVSVAAQNSVSSFGGIVALSDGRATSDRSLMIDGGGGSYVFQAVESNTTVANISGGTVASGWQDFMTVTATNAFEFFVDGVSIGTDTSGAAPDDIDRLRLGAFQSGGNIRGGFVGLPLRIYDKVVTP